MGTSIVFNNLNINSQILIQGHLLEIFLGYFIKKFITHPKKLQNSFVEIWQSEQSKF